MFGGFTVFISLTPQNKPPAASFTYSPSSPTTADTIQFTDTSSDEDGQVVSWLWNFGDGGASALQNPTYRYTKKGTYTVTLTVTDDRGSTNNESRSITVANSPPTANFTYSPASPTTADTIQFTDTSSDPDGRIVSWSWAFGDGATSTAQNPTYRYTNNGTYTVTLIVTDDGGLTNNKSHSITVANLPPTASFTHSPASTISDNIQFTDTSSDPDGRIVSWSWAFGDGTTSTSQTPTHQYTTGGTYTVTLTVTDDDGSTDSHSEVIIVAPMEVMFQNFEVGNGTPGAYFYDAWRSSPVFEFTIVHNGARSVKMSAPAPNGGNGATIGINVASSSGYLDLTSATIFSVWVYDTQGNNTVEMKLKDSDGTIGPGLWSTMLSTQNVWTKITWDISGYSGVGLNKSQIASVEFYEWNQGVYYFDDVSFIL